jgi:beta-lactamase regulating signal transducer with metallopeptidase domain
METVFTNITDYLLRQSWQIAILFAVVAIICIAIRKKTAHLRYLLWLLILAKCLVPSLITVSLAILPQKPLPPQPLPESAPIREFAPPPESVILSPGAPGKNLSPPAPAPTPQPSIMAQLAQIRPKTWFSGIWLCGVGLYLLIVLIKAARFNRRLRGQRKSLGAGMQKEIDELLERFGVHAKLDIWLLDGIGQPFVWGLLRGAIYLPANFGRIGSREHRRGILMHEITHVARFDAAVNCLQTIAQAIFWFHPLVWWANRNIRAEREKCCDETAIAKLSAAPRVYSSAIVDTLIAEYQSTQPIPSLAIAGPIKNIEDRIKTIMKPGKKFYNRPTIIAFITILLLAIIAVPTTIALTHRQPEKPEEFLAKDNIQVEAEGEKNETVQRKAFTESVLINALERGNSLVIAKTLSVRANKQTKTGKFYFYKTKVIEPIIIGDLRESDIKEPVELFAGSSFGDALTPGSTYALFIAKGAPYHLSWGFRNDVIKLDGFNDENLQTLMETTTEVYKKTSIHEFREAKLTEPAPYQILPEMPAIEMLCELFRTNPQNRAEVAKKIYESDMGSRRDLSEPLSSIMKYLPPKTIFSREEIASLLGEPTLKCGWTYKWYCGPDKNNPEHVGILSITFDQLAETSLVLYDKNDRVKWKQAETKGSDVQVEAF